MSTDAPMDALADPAQYGQLKRLRQELVRWSYKPGWSMTIDTDPYLGMRLGLCLGAVLVVRATVAERDSGRPVTIESRSVVPDYLADHMDAFGPWLQGKLFDVERHESREWLRRDGELFDDPHRPASPATVTTGTGTVPPAGRCRLHGARRRANLSLCAAVVLLAAQCAVLVAGLDQLRIPLMLATWFALGVYAQQSGWASGYQAARADTSQ